MMARGTGAIGLEDAGTLATPHSFSSPDPKLKQNRGSFWLDLRSHFPFLNHKVLTAKNPTRLIRRSVVTLFLTALGRTTAMAGLILCPEPKRLSCDKYN